MATYIVTSWTGNKTEVQADSLDAAFLAYGYMHAYADGGRKYAVNGANLYLLDDGTAMVTNSHGDECARIART